jgi:hypothetical protein
MWECDCGRQNPDYVKYCRCGDSGPACDNNQTCKYEVTYYYISSNLFIFTAWIASCSQTGHRHNFVRNPSGGVSCTICGLCPTGY